MAVWPQLSCSFPVLSQVKAKMYVKLSSKCIHCRLLVRHLKYRGQASPEDTDLEVNIQENIKITRVNVSKILSFIFCDYTECALFPNCFSLGISTLALCVFKLCYYISRCRGCNVG